MICPGCFPGERMDGHGPSKMKTDYKCLTCLIYTACSIDFVSLCP